MQIQQFAIQNNYGNILPGAYAYLYLPDTTTLASGLQDADGNALDNPLLADSNGFIQFAAPDGDYDLRVTSGGLDRTMRVQFQSAELLRHELEGSVALGKGALMVSGSVVVLNSVDELNQITPFLSGKKRHAFLRGYYPGSTLGGGLVEWVPTSSQEEDGGVVFGNSPQGRWVRPINNGVVNLEWFGLDYTGGAPMQDRINAAIAATPEGGTLRLPDIEGTLLLDVPTATEKRPAAITVNKPISVIQNSPKLVLKIKDFCEAYINWGDVVSGFDNAAYALKVTHSNVLIDGLVIDANADNHYEEDSEGWLWWEVGPENKRPPSGIVVYCPRGNNNVTGVAVKNCKVVRPLAGISAIGDLEDPSDPSFLNSDKSTDVVIDCSITGNRVYRARGNDYLFSNGVKTSTIKNNYSEDSLYHCVRYYNSVVDCHATNNDAYVNYERVEGKYNLQSKGFWRTNKVSAPEYLITRAGYKAGSAYSNSVLGLPNIKDSSIKNNKISWPSSAAGESIIDLGSISLAAFQCQGVAESFLIKSNEAYNPPVVGVFLSDPPSLANRPFSVKATGNYVFSSRRYGAFIEGFGFEFSNNTLDGCAIASGYEVVRIRGDKHRVCRNSISFDGANNNRVFNCIVLTGGPDVEVMVSNNEVSGYSGNRLTAGAGVTVHGTDGGGVLIPLKNGWKNYTTSPSIDSPLKAIIDCSGNVSIMGLIDGSAATSSEVGDLPEGYHTRENRYFMPFQSVDGTVVAPTAFSARIEKDKLSVDAVSQGPDRLWIEGGWVADHRF